VSLGGAELPVVWALVVLFAVGEAALHHQSWSKLEEELEGPRARARYARYLEHRRVYSGICLAARVGAAALLVWLIGHRAWQETGRFAAALPAAAALIVVAELVGRLVGRRWSSWVLLLALPLLYALAYPVREFKGLARVSAADEEPEPEVVAAAEEEIRVALEDGAVEGALEAEQKQMIEGILRFREVDVAQVMTPRPDIESLEADTELAEAIRLLESYHHSRVPVYERTLDRVVGVVYVKDLLPAARGEGPGRRVRDVMRPALFVPETKALGPLLQELQNQHVQMAVVLDEYGGVRGVVTVEDIMEEIVGEIQDEYDDEDLENRLHVRSAGGVEADARVRIDEINEQFDLDVPEDEAYDTIGGFVTTRFARVPDAGEELRTDGLLVRILQSGPRAVRRVFLKRLEPGRTA
jgi:CBS domain containing-hemolysin-like protein